MGLSEFLDRLPHGDLWVFGYGSLMWAPGFRPTERSVAMLHGYHRALCILSNRHRGTPRKPGLVMGLCRGGSCRGMALRVPASRARPVLARLWRREMRNRVYEPRLLPVRVGTRHVRALAFVANPGHPQFVRALDVSGRARLVAQGVGGRGRCLDYIRNTLAHLAALGVRDANLECVLQIALELRSGRLNAHPAPAASARAPRRAARAASRN